MYGLTRRGVVGGLLIAGAVTAVSRLIRQYSFENKVVVISGGSRGLGLLLARKLGKEGAKLFLIARDQAELERAQSELQESGFDVAIRVCDVTNQDEVNDTAAYAMEHYGSVDVLINNAGVIQVGPMDSMTTTDYEAALKTHFWGPLYMTMAFSPGMRMRKAGRIVNISSIGGKVAVPHLLPYAVSKFALLGYSEGLRMELLRDKVYVTSVCPGLMRTGSHINAQFKGQNVKEFAWFSIGDSMPFLSADGDSAAKQIVEACRRGDPELIITLPAQILSKLNGIFPGAVTDIMGHVNKILPAYGGIGQAQVSGRESTSELSPSVLTSMADAASLKNNEV
ncbi:MAG: SDR family oxidoreductase [Candidatus Melainabacteria bacterium]|nr:SDR family oxidoreductase [Candidatus Melainabacteria bacterium]